MENMDKLKEVLKYLKMAVEKLEYCLDGDKSEGPVGSIDELKERAKGMAESEMSDK